MTATPRRSATGKHPTSFRLSQQALDLLAALAGDAGLSHTAVVEMALRDLAKARKVPMPASTKGVTAKRRKSIQSEALK